MVQNVCFRVLSCTIEDKQTVWDLDGTTVCWRGVHLAYAVPMLATAVIVYTMSLEYCCHYKVRARRL